MNNDCISRNDILDAIGHGTTYTSEELQKIINKLPAANSKVSAGVWDIYQDNDGIYGWCDNCNMDTDFTHYGRPDKFCFCPHCGREMRVE